MQLILLTLLLMVQPCLALPSLPDSWRIGQQVHVKFTNFTPEDEAEATNYIRSRIEPLNLDINLVFDNNIRRQDGLLEGIEIRNLTSTTTVCAKTTTLGGLDNNNQWAVWKIIKLDTTCEGGTREQDIFWHNNILHEFLHALFIDHIRYINPMPAPLMFSSEKLREELLWTFNDEFALKRKYSRDKILNYKAMQFRRKDLGKTAYLIQGDKSVSFPIKYQFTRLAGLRGKYKRIIL